MKAQRAFRIVVVLLLAVVGVSCRNAGSRRTPEGTLIVRLAYFPNVTHGVALVGSARKTFSDALGNGVKIEEQIFNAGPAEIEALFGDQIDIGYIGPGPALNGFLKSKGKALKIVAGASSGGASLVVRADSGITNVKQLAGKKVASPQTGGTQDISLRHALQQAGLGATDKGGQVSLLPTANPDTLTLFVKRELDAAWVPEPWVARLVKEGNGKILIDERDQWPDRKFATTIVIVRTRFLESNSGLVSKFLGAHLDTVDWIQKNPDETLKIVGEQIKKLTKKAIPEDVLKDALSRTDFTHDPLRETVLTFADWSKQLGFQRSGREELNDLFDLKPVNAALESRKLAKLP